MPVIKKVDGVKVSNPHRASCHCGRVVLELELPNGIEKPRHCDCSIRGPLGSGLVSCT
mgnify:CR=1 FL=1